MTLVIIDYGSGNLRSVAKAFEHVGGKILVTSNAKEVANADRIVLPGVGAYGDCMKGLSALPGMVETLGEQVREKKKPFLGICVGMQLMFERGLEHGEYEGLGWLQGEVVRLKPSPLEGEGCVGGGSTFSASGTTPHPNPPPQGGRELKIPHMGWNELAITKEHPLFRGITSGTPVYFVHSYHAQAAAGDILATTDYGGKVTAAVAHGNMMGTQFHPEKSQQAGLAILQNFLKI